MDDSTDERIALRLDNIAVRYRLPEHAHRTLKEYAIQLLQGRVRYRGAPDADYKDPALDAAWLREALDAVLDGREPTQAETEPVGCSVKWKS